MDQLRRTHGYKHDDEFLNMTAEYRATLQGPEFYIIDADNINLGQDDMYLHSELIIPNNHNFISWILDTPISYLGQTHGNWWTEYHYSEGLRWSGGGNRELKEGWWWDKLYPGYRGSM